MAIKRDKAGRFAGTSGGKSSAGKGVKSRRTGNSLKAASGSAEGRAARYKANDKAKNAASRPGIKGAAAKNARKEASNAKFEGSNAANAGGSKTPAKRRAQQANTKKEMQWASNPISTGSNPDAKPKRRKKRTGRS